MFILTTGNGDNPVLFKNQHVRKTKQRAPLYSPEAAVAFVGVEAAA